MEKKVGNSIKSQQDFTQKYLSIWGSATHAPASTKNLQMTLKSSVGSLAKSSQKTTSVGISDVETIHPWKLIRKQKMDGWKQPSIFGFHVSFQGCIKSTSPIFRGYVSCREGYHHLLFLCKNVTHHYSPEAIWGHPEAKASTLSLLFQKYPVNAISGSTKRLSLEFGPTNSRETFRMNSWEFNHRSR